MTINNTLDLYKGPLPRYSHNSFCLTVFVEKKLEIRDRCRSLEKKDCFFSTLPRTAPGCLGFRPTSFFSDFSELKNLNKKKRHPPKKKSRKKGKKKKRNIYKQFFFSKAVRVPPIIS